MTRWIDGKSEGEAMATVAIEAPRNPGKGKTMAILLLLMAINAANFIDRQIITILVEPMRAELQLTDAQIGLLTGLAFATLYVICGLALARMADRGNRPAIITGALIVWSGFTMASGAAANFVQLLLARIGVGVGEAGCTPAAHSLISDLVPPERRASALGVYGLGVPIGSLIGLCFGGILANELGWRLAFVCAGIPGFILASIVWMVPEPRKHRPPAAADTRPTLAAAIREMRSKPAFVWLCAGSGIAAFVYYGQTSFYGAYFMRNHSAELAGFAEALGLKGPLAFLGLGLGLAIGIGGGLGTFFGGRFAEWGLGRDRAAYALVPGAATFISAPLFVGAVLATHLTPALLLLVAAVFFQGLTYGPMFGAAQNLVSPRCRAIAAAILLFVVNMVGLGFGPLSIGLMSDAFAANYGPAIGLRWAMAIAAAVMVVPLACFLMARRTFVRDCHLTGNA
jgi:MFS family permease